MFRTLLFLVSLLVPIGLVWVFGFWVLLAVFALTGTTLLFSTRKGRGAEATQGGGLTGYHATTARADL